MGRQKRTDRGKCLKFISLVECNPVLYDSSLPEHRDPELVHNVWSTIARLMGSSEVDAEGWKKKWKCMRDYHVKQKKRLARSETAIEERSSWKFSTELAFLDPHIKSSDKPSVFAPDVEEETSFENGETSVYNDIDQPAETLYRPYNTVSRTQSPRISRSEKVTRKRQIRHESPNSPSPSPPVKKSREDLENAIAQLVTEMRKSREQNSVLHSGDPDGDGAFFLSCALRMKKLPAKSRSYLKVQISQLFVNAENPDLPPMTILPIPSENSVEPVDYKEINYS